MATELLTAGETIIVDEDHSMSADSLHAFVQTNVKKGKSLAWWTTVPVLPKSVDWTPIKYDDQYPAASAMLAEPVGVKEGLRKELDTLQLAKQRLIVNGWVQRTGQTADGRICLGTALQMTEGSNRASLRVQNMLPVPIPEWNDRPSRKFEEVIALLDKAILCTLEDLARAA
jgi:hypothetical protein